MKAEVGPPLDEGGLGRNVPYLAWVQWEALEALPEPLGPRGSSLALGPPADQGKALQGQKYGASCPAMSLLPPTPFSHP